MSQFMVHENADPVSRKLMPYLLNIQSDLIETAGSRVVVPLIPPERTVVIDQLMPSLTVGRKRLVMDTPQVAGVPMRMLGKPVADLSHERRAILDAIDMLTHGI